MELNRLSCCFSELVTNPINEYTDTLIMAKEIPTQANKMRTEVNEFPQYIPRHPANTRPNAISIPFLYPSLGKNEPTRNETNAIERSLKASRELAVISSTW